MAKLDKDINNEVFSCIRRKVKQKSECGEAVSKWLNQLFSCCFLKHK